MDENRIEGSARDIGGKLQDATGELTGGTSTQIRGKANQAAGQAQDTYGKLVDQYAENDAGPADDGADLGAGRRSAVRLPAGPPLTPAALGQAKGRLLEIDT